MKTAWMVVGTAALLVALAIVYIILERRATTKAAGGGEIPYVVFKIYHPLGCDMIVAQRSAGEKWVSMCYIRSRTLPSSDERQQ